jgi:oxygen-dependent protoporphyrinogen oxidase
MQDLTPRRIFVIGGGITGLAAVWRLQQVFQKSGVPHYLQLLESTPHLGGSLKSVRREGFLLEGGPDCFISEKPRGVGLCRELGLEGELMETRPQYRRSFILRKGKFHQVPEGFYLMGPSRTRPFLESGLLSWSGKFRVMLEPLIPRRLPSDESLASFVRRRFGQELLDWMAQPLIAGIYGANPAELSLRSTFPQFLDMERTYGSVVFGLKKRGVSAQTASGPRYSLFLTLRGGMQTLSDQLAAKIGTNVIQTGTRVKEIRRTDNGWHVVKANGEILIADAVCLAMPSYAAADLLRNVDPDLSGELAAIPYAPAATLNFAFREMDVKRPLNGIGFVIPEKENRLVLGGTFAQYKFEGRAPKGFMLIRAFLGGARRSSWTNEKEEPLTQRVFNELKDLLGITGKPMFTQVERYNQALPQYNVGHLQRILKIEEQLLRYGGLSLAGNWSYGIGIPDCIEAGERAAGQLITYLERREPSVSSGIRKV